ncbi:Radial spoke head protein 3 [Clydaea vesicula]|uniref:Radial spoke head protein 3 n=1 Tax=Clydaea vesicula TaxID=447962 RepID=A0AAD5XWX7_9FUNG|nr:Radial spoke head protein 3 [Clydaea vesicula]
MLQYQNPPLPIQKSQTQVETNTHYDPNQTQHTGAENYTFSSEPRPLQENLNSSQKKKLYRDPIGYQNAENENEVGKNPPVNIMYDRRIHRGNTYASPILPLHAQQDPIALQSQQTQKRRQKAKRKADQSRRLLTPEPVEGRKHIDIQTDLYLEELSDKIPEAIAATQTDAFLDRAPSPLYIPQKSGVDVFTQVYEGELFDFDVEVQPILEVLVGKTVEQALMEVMEEEELDMLKRRQAEYEERRNAELAEVQRLEDAERRRTEEKERRLAEQVRILREKQELQEKITSRAFAISYLQKLVPSVFESLTTNGYFYDLVEKEVETLFLPWLTSEVELKLEKLIISQKVVDGMLKISL